MAFELLGKMRENNIRPNVVTYNALVDVCCKNGDLSRAEAVVQQMQESE